MNRYLAGIVFVGGICVPLGAGHADGWYLEANILKRSVNDADYRVGGSTNLAESHFDLAGNVYGVSGGTGSAGYELRAYPLDWLNTRVELELGATPKMSRRPSLRPGPWPVSSPRRARWT